MNHVGQRICVGRWAGNDRSFNGQLSFGTRSTGVVVGEVEITVAGIGIEVDEVGNHLLEIITSSCILGSIAVTIHYLGNQPNQLVTSEIGQERLLIGWSICRRYFDLDLRGVDTRSCAR